MKKSRILIISLISLLLMGIVSYGAVPNSTTYYNRGNTMLIDTNITIPALASNQPFPINVSSAGLGRGNYIFVSNIIYPDSQTSSDISSTRLPTQLRDNVTFYLSNSGVSDRTITIRMGLIGGF